MLDIRFPDWAVADRQAGQTLILGLYDGKIYIRVRGRGGDKNTPPLFMKKLDRPSMFRKFRKMCEKILTCPPETKLPCKFPTYDIQSKQEKLLWVLVLEKDSKMCYRIHLTDAQNGGRTYTFALNGSRSMQIGSEPMSESDRSADMLQDLIDWLNLAHHWYPATIKPFDPNAQRGGRGNFRGGNRGTGNSGGYQQRNNNPPPPAAPSSEFASNPDDLPF